MNDLFRVLIVGGGSIGERHLRCFGQLQNVQVGICTRCKETRIKLSDRYNTIYADSSLERALRHDYDVAVICTPSNLHVDMTITCANHDLHVLIEKPLSTDKNRLRDLISAVEANGVICGVGYTYRSFSSVQNLREALEQKELGNIRQTVVHAGQEFFQFRPAYASTYFASHQTGGGAIQDCLTHLLDCSTYLIGPITKVCADAHHKGLSGVSVEDTVHVLARHGDIPACYALNQYQAPNETTVTIVGSDATARLEIVRNSWSIMHKGETQWKERYSDPVERDVHFIRQAKCFLDAIYNGGKFTCSLSEGIESLNATLAVLYSARTGGTWEDGVFA